MKIRHLEQKLEKSGYHFVRNGKGSGSIFVTEKQGQNQENAAKIKPKAKSNSYY